MDKRFLFLFVGLLLISSVSATWYLPWTWFDSPDDTDFSIQEDLSLGVLNISNNNPEWNVIKATDQEAELTFWTASKDIKKTELGWIPSSGSCTGWDDKYLYNNLSERILDNKNKEIKLKCESSKCDGANCYHITLTEAQSINIDEYVKLGENSIVSEYQDISLLQYDLDFGQANVTLFKNISGTYNNSVNSIWINYNNDSYKFGANDSSLGEGETANYKYQVKSDIPLYKDKNTIYVKNPTPIKSSGSSHYETHEFDFSDVCNRYFNETNQSANCQFTSYNIWNRNETNNETNITVSYYDYYYEVTFISDSDIDPLITIGSSDWITTSLLTNVTAEIGDANFTHLNVSNTAPYDSLVGYWNFDGDLENTELATAYDWSGEGNDGTMVGNAVVNSSGGRYGDGALFDGDLDYVDMGTPESLDFGTNMNFSVSAWVYSISDLGGNRKYVYTKRGGSCAGYTYSGFEFAVGYEDLYFYLDDGPTELVVSTTTNPISNSNQWYHVSFVANTTKGVLYLNGVAIGNPTDISSVNNVSAPNCAANIGKRSDSSNNEWNGSIDDVMIFNTSLTSAQITAIYNNQSARYLETGTQRVRAVNIEQDGTYNRVNLSTTLDEELGSNVTARIGQINMSVNTSGLVAYYPFEWGKANDISGEGSDGSIVNAVWNESGGLNETGGFVFNGLDNWVDMDFVDSLYGASSMTVSAWVKESSYSGGHYIAAEGDVGGTRIFVFCLLSGDPYFVVYNGSAVASSTARETSGITDNDWHHVVGVYNGTNTMVYLDTVIGSDIGSLTGEIETNEGKAWLDSLKIGAAPNAIGDPDGSYFNGSIDDVMIFNRSLSVEEISDLYSNQSAKHNNIYYTDYQYITSDTNYTYTISTEADFVLPDYKLEAGNSTTSFYSPIISGDANFTINNNVPVIDTSFTVSLPIGYTEINFSSNNKTVSNLEAGGQNTIDGVIEITNTGDVGLDFYLILNQTIAGFILFGDTDNTILNSKIINTTSNLIIDNLGTSSSQFVWLWLNWTDKTPATIQSKLNGSVTQN